MPTVVELEPSDAPALQALYQDWSWWDHRTVEGVRGAIAATDLPLGLREDDRLVAAARVLGDFQYYATVYDVVVAADRRGEGLGRHLVEAVVDHPELSDVEVLQLDCEPDLVPFYEQFGFEVRETDPEMVAMVLE